MSPRKAAARRHSAPPPDRAVPLADAKLLARFQEVGDASLRYAGALSRFLAREPPERVNAWMQACIAGARPALAPWCLEILFLLAYHEELRFNELATRLGGVSSRTLTDKLADLQEAGLVAKRVDLEGTAVRIRYSLTERGFAAAILVGPFMSLMNPQGGFASAAPRQPG